ncbi:hypothetical protein [Cupriavidus basilensis]|uniref:hypothetical protein n=1 Tax=Cupriavidus basilensis TaxID=68895 RepID=UPI00114711BF|nr:hypothetical protein [Cupriavidus basilensis]
MNQRTKFPVAMKNVQFDEFGRYEVTEIIEDEELDLVSGGDDKCESNTICPNMPGCLPRSNIFCPNPPPPTPPPPRNNGEDGDGE